MHSNTKEDFLKLDRPVPRYTSYPTAPHFSADFEKHVYKDWLCAMAAESRLSLYFHIPFCPKLCWFCGCNTKITKRYAPVEDYLHLLLREIEMTGGLCSKKQKVTHMHFGGGSPTMLRSCDFRVLMDGIRSAFNVSEQAEIAIEIDPRQMSEAKAASYAMAGVTRASLGVQDFNSKVLESVNRMQPFFASYETVKILRDYGINKINLDLMYGLPHQTLETMKICAEQALLLAPDRIALFGYAHVPWMKKHMRLIPERALPDAKARLDLFDTAAEIFIQAGYVPIGIDHFAKPGDSLMQAKQNGRLHRNFQGYTDDKPDALLGFGVSAISRLMNGFVQNSPQMPLYRESILNGQLPTEKFFCIRDEDRLREEVIQSLMCTFSAQTGDICEKYSYPRDYFRKEIDTLESLQSSGFLKISDTGGINVLVPQAARLACAAFDSYLQPSVSQRHVTST